MYIYKLARLNVVTPIPNSLRSVVVVAQNEAQARTAAQAMAGDEGRSIWEDETGSNCVMIGTAGEHYAYPGIICADFLEG